MKAYYLFGKPKSAELLKGEIEMVVQDLRKLNTKEEVLEAAYKAITTRYEGKRFHTYIKIFDLFSDGIQDLWNRRGFMHCTNQNYLLHNLLVASGKFKNSDIKAKWTLYFGVSPHQYLQIKTGKNKFINIDAWSAAYGIKYGDYAHGFHTGS
jgi:hypothetical protein